MSNPKRGISAPALAVLLLASLSAGACSFHAPLALLPSTRAEEANEPDTIPDEFRRSGMISSSTYQVYMVTYADSPEMARKNGEVLIKRKAYDLIMKEPFTRRHISPYSQQKVRDLVETGKVIMMKPLSGNSYGLVLQIHKRGLRDYFQSLR